jgi:hypothetical protein
VQAASGQADAAATQTRDIIAGVDPEQTRHHDHEGQLTTA